jgi:hypothetical protein
MTDKKISELTEITGANTAADDYFVIVEQRYRARRLV